MFRKTHIGFAVVALIAVGGWFSLSNRVSVAAGLLHPDNPELIREGELLYGEHCAACHGIRLEGQPSWRLRKVDGRLPAPPHNETGHTWHHPDELLVRITLHGPQSVAGPNYLSDMPAYEGVLNEQQIIAILSYIKSTWPTGVREQHDAINEQSRR